MHPLPEGSFDVVISRFGIMFFDDPVAAFTNIGRAVRPGGRVAFLSWQDMTRNDWLMVPAGAALQHVGMPELGEPGAPGPFSLSDPAQVAEVLAAAGFEAIAVDPVEAPMRVGADAEDACEFLRGTETARILLDKADAETVNRALQAVTDALRPYEQPGGVYLDGAAWLATAGPP